LQVELTILTTFNCWFSFKLFMGNMKLIVKGLMQWFLLFCFFFFPATCSLFFSFSLICKTIEKLISYNIVTFSTVLRMMVDDKFEDITSEAFSPTYIIN
jgi:hypothetical protein